MLRARTAGTAPAVDSAGPETAGPPPAVDSAGRSEPRRTRGGGVSRGSAVAVGGLRRIVHLIVCVVVLIILAGIALVWFKANAANSIVSDVHDAARWLAGPFDGIFSFRSARTAVAVNWGVAVLVYLIVGMLIVRVLRPAARPTRGRASAPGEELA
jgi:hypothetical protein